MGIEENKATLRRVFDEVWNNNNLEVMDECFSENFIRHGISGTSINLDEFKQFLIRVRSWIPDIQRVIDEMVAEDDMIAFSFKWKGTDTGGFGGRPPTGKYLTVQECYFARFENGKIVEITQHADALGPLQELGIVPSMEEIQKTRKEAKTTEENKAKQRRVWEEVFNKGNLDIIPEFFAPNYVFSSPLGMEAKGPEEFKKMAAMMLNALPDVHVTINDIFAEGDRVVTRFTLTGTFKDEMMGIAPTGKQVSFNAIIITRWEGGKEVEAWESLDTLAFYQQLGVISPINQGGG